MAMKAVFDRQNQTAGFIALCALVLVLDLLLVWDLRIGVLLLVLSLGALLGLLALFSKRRRLAQVLLVSTLWLGFFHEPITSGNLIFWGQEAIIAGLMGVMLLRGGTGRRTRIGIVFIVLISIALITLVGTISRESILLYLNGLRRISAAPMMFVLAQYLAHGRSGETVFRILVWTLMLQLPCSLVVGWISAGSVSTLPGADFLTGTFGKGGSGFMVIFISAVLCIVVWQFANRRTSLSTVVFATSYFLVLGAISDLKFLWIILPFGLLATFWIVLIEKRGRVRWKNALMALVGVVLVCVALKFVISLSSERHHAGELSLASFFEVDFLKTILFIDSGGVYRSPDGEYKFSRYGALVYAWDYLSHNRWMLTGHGLGSTTEGILGETTLGKKIGIGQLDVSTISLLLFEVGVVGTFLYLTPFLVITVMAFLRLLRRQGRGGDLELLSGILALYGLFILLSLGYNGFAIVPRGGGVFWFIAGLWLVALRKPRHRLNRRFLIPVSK